MLVITRYKINILSTHLKANNINITTSFIVEHCHSKTRYFDTYDITCSYHPMIATLNMWIDDE